MKKMWKLNNKAVSPVIATILMVAITVVLAAVLYVMVMGFGGDTNQAPTADLTADGNRLVVSMSESQTIAPNMELSLIINGTAQVFNPLTAGIHTYATNSTTIVFTDAGLDGKVSVGDYFTRTVGSQPVVIKLVYSSGGTNTIIAEGTI